MQRVGESLGSLGPQLAGEKIAVNRRVVTVVKQLGEGAVIRDEIWLVYFCLMIV